MKYCYTEKKACFENELKNLLFDIKKRPGVYIGEASLTKLFHFLSGYEYAIMTYENYRLHFDKDFQRYIQLTTKCEGNYHWNQILSEGRTEREAFEKFYEQIILYYQSGTGDG